jgi:hypothetical protein
MTSKRKNRLTKMPSIVPLMRKEELAKLPTKALLARLQRLHACEESLAASDRRRGDASADGIEFKDSPTWRSALADVKALLATREHVAKPAERGAARAARAKQNRSRERRTLGR